MNSNLDQTSDQLSLIISNQKNEDISATTSMSANAGLSNEKEANRTGGGRKRQRKFLKSIVEKMESFLLRQEHRRPTWLKEIISQSSEQFVPSKTLVDHSLCKEGKNVGDVIGSRGFLPILRQSEFLEVDASGAHVRSKVPATAQDGLPTHSNCILYVDNLPAMADDVWLHNAFSRYGRLIDAWVIKPKNKAAVAARRREEEERKSGKPNATPNGHRKNKGFGFVQFSQPSMAERVLKEFRGQKDHDGNVTNEPVDTVGNQPKCNQEISPDPSGLAKRKLSIQDQPSEVPSKKVKSICQSDHDFSSDGCQCHGETQVDAKEENGKKTALQSGICRKRRKRRNRSAKRQFQPRQEKRDKWISNLQVYSWSEWRDKKRAYLTGQKANYSKLKAEMKKVKELKGKYDGLLVTKDRYGEGKKEMRGRDKLIRRAEAMKKIRCPTASVDDQKPAMDS